MGSQINILKGTTFKDSDSLGHYFKEIRKEEVLDKKEEVRLSKLISKGDHLALEKLVKANLKFVILVAKQHQGQGILLVDLINEGNIGLIKAAKKFDHTKGYKFISYAVWWIRQSIYNAVFYNTRVIRLPNNKSANITKINSTISILEQELEREPSYEEISIRVGIPELEVKSTLISFNKIVSMDEEISEDDNRNMQSFLIDQENFQNDHENDSLHKDILRTMTCLHQKEIDCILFSYGINCLPLTMDEISKIINLNISRVWHLINKGQQKLKENNNLIKNYI
jgi:RNA polymerase primary sigma factor